MNDQIIKTFYENRNDEHAEGMTKYMKYKFPFLGIKRPERSKLQREVIKQYKKSSEIDWDFINKLWSLPEREFQYFAIDILIACDSKLKSDDLVKVKNLIIQKSWWDTVDLLASKVTGAIANSTPEVIANTILKWSQDDNLWLKRTAILFQLKYKENTDKDVLSQVILENCDTDEFFLNKAIGWILREYSKTNRDWVESFISRNTLSKLSIREGSKYL